MKSRATYSAMAKRRTGKRPLVIGLTGGIGSGKSTVLGCFRALGAAVIDADAISRSLTADGGPLIRKIKHAFGPAVFRGGHLDRHALAQAVFPDSRKRERLERITHPAILAEMEREIVVEARRGKRIIVLDIPLLFERGLETKVDTTVVVWVPRTIQERRIRERGGLTCGEIRERCAVQMPLSEKRARADYVIDNSGTRGGTRGIVKKLWKLLTKRGELV